MSDDPQDYLWKHFAFNAEQRLKAFHFFVIFSGFASGGILTTFANENSHPVVSCFLGFFVCLLSVIFYLIDRRSRKLLQMTKPGLIKCEEALPKEARVFTLDHDRSKWASYTFAFHVLFVFQFLFGFGVLAIGLCRWMH